MKKEWFKKVDALERFVDYWSYGRGVGSMPSHNIYVPVSNTIMPRPKFRDIEKQDQMGTDFTLRSHDKHSISPAFDSPTSVKPSPVSPAVQPRDNSAYAYARYSGAPPFKFNTPKRLARVKGQKMATINMPMKWRFSTLVGLTEAEE